jgi:hypothetical protein
MALSTSAEVDLFNRVPIGPRFAANRGALPTRLNAIMPNYFCRGPYLASEELANDVHPNSVNHPAAAAWRTDWSDPYDAPRGPQTR